MLPRSLQKGLQMHVDAKIYDCDGSDNIDIAIDAYVYSVYSTFAYSAVGLASLVGAIMYRKRRRRIQTMNAAVEDPTGGDFEMMRDQAVVV